MLDTLNASDRAAVKLAAAQRFAELNVRPSTANYVLGRYLDKAAKLAASCDHRDATKPRKATKKEVKPNTHKSAADNPKVKALADKIAASLPASRSK